MNANLDRWIDEHRDEIVESLIRCVRFPSLKAEPLPGAPFGQSIQDCLEDTLELASSMGFDVKDGDGYYGLIDYGEGEETLGILAHLDVVPAGTGWKFDPFGGEIDDGRIYGRGTLDDKGPVIAALYALKAIKESGIPLKRKVRIILGCDEESGWACMKRFLKNEEIPTLSYSPDSEYPLTNSEKGILRADFEAEFDSQIHMEAGEVANVVPGEASARVRIDAESVRAAAEAFAEEEGFKVEVTEDVDVCDIKLIGEFAHASMPESGRNAIQGLICLLSRLPFEGKDAEVLESLKESFGMDYHGQGVGLDKADESGRLTLNIGIIRWGPDGMKLTFDLRCPTSMREDEPIAALGAAMEKIGAKLINSAFKEGYSLPDDSEIVTKLLNVYEKRTGKRLPPKKIGGGTYARALPNAVSFGPEYEGMESAAHMANEHMLISDLIFNTKINADAIVALAGE